MRKLLGVLSLFAYIASAHQDPVACGTHAERSREELFLHRQAMRHRPAAQAVAAARDAGQIALIEDADGVVARRNPFDLDQKTLAFRPTPAGYRFDLSGPGYDDAAAAAGVKIDLKDDDSRTAALPFPFPFFGVTWRQIYINSDGNLTFGAGDSASSDRSLGRFTAGPPRIAPLFSDLDPSRSQRGALITADPTHFVVTWAAVPVYTATGIGSAQTFQVRLYPDGRVEMFWNGISATDAVVGIAPGELRGGSSVLSFTAGSSQEFTAAVGERFSGANSIDTVTAAQKFYQTHDDAYDYLVIYNVDGIPAAPGALAYEVTVRNQRTGYGDQILDTGQQYGSPSRLQAVLNMGTLDQYPADPNAIVPGRAISHDTSLTVLGHETGHLFLAYVSVRDPNSPSAQPMLGRQLAHWSFLFNSEASLLEGNRIQDNGPNVTPRFLTIATAEGYAPLDQYLMGFRAPEEVPPTFLVTNSPSIPDGSRAPQSGVPFSGIRRDIAVDEIAAVAGRRTPDSTVAQRRFRFGFLLVVPAGGTPTQAQLSQLDNLRSAFEGFYQRAASSRAFAETTLRQALHLSAFPAAGVLAGASATVTLTLDTPAAAAETLLLGADTGAISAPQSVTIAAGATQASFPIAGVRPGVDTLTAQPADAALYETAFAKVNVAAGPGQLRLTVAGGDRQTVTPGQALPQPVALRVSDLNDLPYPGVTVKATVSSGGSLDAGAAITDRTGTARFRWTPGPGPLNDLTASLDGGPAATVSALARPFVAPGGVVNAASYAVGFSPGSIATLFGANLLDPTVTVDGIPATVFFANNRQVNFLVPASLNADTAQVLVTTALGASDPVSVPVIAISPGLFAAVQRGAFVEIYGTGLGPLSGGVTVNPSRVFFGSVEASVTYSGQAPGFVGLYQVNARIPAAIGSGPQSLSLTMAGIQSNPLSISLTP